MAARAVPWSRPRRSDWCSTGGRRSFASRRPPIAGRRRPASPSGSICRWTTDHDARALYQQTFDGVPLYNGFSGYFAPHNYALRRARRRQRSAHPPGAELARAPRRRHRSRGGRVDGAYRKFVARLSGRGASRDARGWSSYTVPANGDGDLLPDAIGRAAPHQGARPRFRARRIRHGRSTAASKTRWSGGVQRSAADFTIELEAAGPRRPSGHGSGRVRRRTTRCGCGSKCHRTARSGKRCFVGDTALHAYYAARPASQGGAGRVSRQPGQRALHLRLTQLGWGKRDWSIAGVQRAALTRRPA